MEQQFESIPEHEQENVLSCFWAMLLFCESEAHHSGSKLDQHMVEGWFKQWNRITGSNTEPIWKAPYV